MVEKNDKLLDLGTGYTYIDNFNSYLKTMNQEESNTFLLNIYRLAYETVNQKGKCTSDDIFDIWERSLQLILENRKEENYE